MGRLIKRATVRMNLLKETEVNLHLLLVRFQHETLVHADNGCQSFDRHLIIERLCQPWTPAP